MDYSIKRNKIWISEWKNYKWHFKSYWTIQYAETKPVNNGLAAIVLHVSIRAVQSADNALCYSPQFCEYYRKYFALSVKKLSLNYLLRPNGLLDLAVNFKGGLIRTLFFFYENIN
jgi:hypothetical protein